MQKPYLHIISRRLLHQDSKVNTGTLQRVGQSHTSALLYLTMRYFTHLSSTTCRPLVSATFQRGTPSVPTFPTPLHSRPLSQTPSLRHPRKDSQHKDSINTEATEYSKSGTDDASARHEDTAFDPGVTDPGHQKDKVGDKTGVNSPHLHIHQPPDPLR